MDKLAKEVSEEAVRLDSTLYLSRSAELIAEGVAARLVCTLDEVTVFAHYDMAWDAYKVQARGKFTDSKGVTQKLKSAAEIYQEDFLRHSNTKTEWVMFLGEFAAMLGEDLDNQLRALEVGEGFMRKDHGGGWIESIPMLSRPRRARRAVARAAKQMDGLGEEITAAEEQQAIESIKQTWKNFEG